MWTEWRAATIVILYNQTSFIFMLFGVVEVCVFFHFSNQDSIAWKKLSEKAFINKIFVTALIIRVIYVLFLIIQSAHLTQQTRFRCELFFTPYSKALSLPLMH